MNNNDVFSNIDLVGAFDDMQLIRYEMWRRRKSDLCVVLDEENNGFTAFAFMCQMAVKDLILGHACLTSENIDLAIKSVLDLNFMDGILDKITKKLLKAGEQDKAWAITSYSMSLDNNEVKWGERKIASYALLQHKKHGVDYAIPDLVMDATWREIQNCIVPKLCLWHIAYLVHP